MCPEKPATDSAGRGVAPETPALPKVRWFERLDLLNVSLLIFLVGVIGSVDVLRGSDRDLHYWQNLVRFAGYFFPPDFSVLGKTLDALVETVQIAVMATLFAVLMSFVIALGAAQNLAPKWLVLTLRMVLNLVRTIPGLVWALIAVAIVGANSLAGVIGLTFYSIGYLGKFFSESFESVDLEVARSLRATGARPFQAFQYGLWPHAKPLILSFSLWMLEYNIRSASIVGYVGAGGIGVQLHIYQSFGEWSKFATVLLCILAVVTLLDLLGEEIRRKIASKLGSRPRTD